LDGAYAIITTDSRSISPEEAKEVVLWTDDLPLCA
jgi:hypothetical protein